MKRIFDITICIFLFALLIFPIVLLIILVRFCMGSPVFFCQSRSGLNGKYFNMYKFRTMRNDYYRNGKQLTDSERLTNFGRFLRSTSLDELPELWNVLKGDMSLVGPRPLLIEYIPLYSPHQARRHEVLPGITGWAQVNGRNTLSWDEKFNLDVWYVDNQSLWLDIKILFMTIKKVILRDGISGAGEATMSKFTGSKS
ncbi:MAG: sugar transferase [Polynucleobacter sp. 39-45-136]|nr:MAG: sugar transferase [Polynucleobacter sp. 39-45-136]